MDLHIHIHHHPDEVVLQQLRLIRGSLSVLNLQGKTLMVTTTEVRQLAADIKAAVSPLPGAIDAFEARITALLKQVAIGGLTATQQQELDDAVTDLRDAVGTITTVVADAGDGVDEADVPAPAP